MVFHAYIVNADRPWRRSADDDLCFALSTRPPPAAPAHQQQHSHSAAAIFLLLRSSPLALPPHSFIRSFIQFSFISAQISPFPQIPKRTSIFCSVKACLQHPPPYSRLLSSSRPFVVVLSLSRFLEHAFAAGGFLLAKTALNIALCSVQCAVCSSA